MIHIFKHVIRIVKERRRRKEHQQRQRQEEEEHQRNAARIRQWWAFEDSYASGRRRRHARVTNHEEENEDSSVDGYFDDFFRGRASMMSNVVDFIQPHVPRPDSSRPMTSTTTIRTDRLFDIPSTSSSSNVAIQRQDRDLSRTLDDQGGEHYLRDEFVFNALLIRQVKIRRSDRRSKAGSTSRGKSESQSKISSSTSSEGAFVTRKTKKRSPGRTSTYQLSKTFLVLNRKTKCSICFQEFREGDCVASSHNSECCHSFHLECIKKWLVVQHRDDCPCCRRNYLASTSDDTAVEQNSGVDLAFSDRERLRRMQSQGQDQFIEQYWRNRRRRLRREQQRRGDTSTRRNG